MRALFLAAALLTLFFSAPGFACSLELPKGKTVLTVQGRIGECNVENRVDFDLAMIEALPKTVVKTENPWEQGVVSYEGVLLRDFLAHVKAEGSILRIEALNDYRSDITAADAEAYDVILAYKREGNYMPVREKGPFFVVFPFTDLPSLATEERFGQSVWQVSRITVR
ncbi:molybdopterin-dependent oxidoreductase [Aestuariivirga sp.]|uniref:molybdopterin-dependent oxidoreductase n=1 Tax=Aestuariivirga sp. TaxID=2650926 RepID=UPI00391C53F4